MRHKGSNGRIIRRGDVRRRMLPIFDVQEEHVGGRQQQPLKYPGGSYDTSRDGKTGSVHWAC